MCVVGAFYLVLFLNTTVKNVEEYLLAKGCLFKGKKLMFLAQCKTSSDGQLMGHQNYITQHETYRGQLIIMLLQKSHHLPKKCLASMFNACIWVGVTFISQAS